jgi:hypothetical protein
MLKLLRGLAPSVLGLFGGSLGLLSIYELENAAGLGGCSCGWNMVEGIVEWPVIVGSLIGLVGGTVFLFNQNAGGTFLLTGGVIASSMIVYLETALLFFGPLVFYLAPNLFFGLLLILGGLLAFPKTRHLIKTLHNEGWIP